MEPAATNARPKLANDKKGLRKVQDLFPSRLVEV